jgi:hypothetical protein
MLEHNMFDHEQRPYHCHSDIPTSATFLPTYCGAEQRLERLAAERRSSHRGVPTDPKPSADRLCTSTDDGQGLLCQIEFGFTAHQRDANTRMNAPIVSADGAAIGGCSIPIDLHS